MLRGFNAPCYGHIAVLRIMQAHRSFQLVVVLPLKVPHFIAYRASRAAPSVALLASSVQFSRCRTGFEAGTKYSKSLLSILV